MNEINPDVFISLPFSLPKTADSANWLAELDFVDVHYGDIDELRKLIESAPSAEAKTWISRIISMRTKEVENGK